MLEKLREKFNNGYDKIKDIFESSPELVEIVINETEKTYVDLKGHEKMEQAIILALGFAHVPAYVSILASSKIVDIIEKIIQSNFDRLKKENKI